MTYLAMPGFNPNKDTSGKSSYDGTMVIDAKKKKDAAKKSEDFGALSGANYNARTGTQKLAANQGYSGFGGLTGTGMNTQGAEGLYRPAKSIAELNPKPVAAPVEKPKSGFSVSVSADGEDKKTTRSTPTLPSGLPPEAAKPREGTLTYADRAANKTEESIGGQKQDLYASSGLDVSNKNYEDTKKRILDEAKETDPELKRLTDDAQNWANMGIRTGGEAANIKAQQVARERIVNESQELKGILEQRQQIVQNLTAGYDEIEANRAQNLFENEQRFGISESQKTNELLQMYIEIEARTREKAEERLAQQKAEFEANKVALEAQANAQIAEQTAQARDLEDKAARDRDKRLKQLKSELKASGRFTTDSEGNRDVETMALLDRITADSDAAFAETSDAIYDNLRSATANIESNKSSQIFKMQQLYSGQQDAVYAAQEQRENAFNQMVLKKAMEDEKLQLAGDSKNGFVTFNSKTGQITPAPGGVGTVDGKRDFADLTSDEQEKVFALGKMVFGTRIANEEGNKILSYVSNEGNKEKSRYDLSLRLLGYTPTNNKELGNELINKVIPYVGENGLPEFPLILIGELLDAGRKKEAIAQVEDFVMGKAKERLGADFINESVVMTKNRQAIELQNLVNSLKDEENPIDPVSGTVEQWIGGFKSQEAQQIATKASRIIAGFLPDLVGTNATSGEKIMYAGLMPQLSDSPITFFEKVDNLRTEPLKELNDQRSMYMLTPLNEYTLFDKGARAADYEALIPMTDSMREELANITSLLTTEDMNLINQAEEKQGVAQQNQPAPTQQSASSAPVANSDGYTPRITAQNYTETRTEEDLAKKYGVSLADIMKVIGTESGGSTTIKNPLSSATGKIQFIESTARGLGTSTEEIAKMSGGQQLALADKMLSTYKNYIKDLPSLYMAIFFPKALNKPDDYVLDDSANGNPAEEIARVNPSIAGGRKVITAGDVRKYIMRK